MAWAIGAGSSGSTPFAPAVGANAIGILRAALLVGVLGFLGAILQGGSVTEAVGNDLILGVTVPPLAAALALAVAAALVATGVFAGYPIATAFTVTGAVIGAGLALGGDPAWGKYQQIAALWIGTPFLGGGIAYAVARFLRSDRVVERVAVPALAAVLGATLAHLRFDLLGAGAEASSMSRYLAWRWGLDPSLAVPAVTVGLAALVAATVFLQMRTDVRGGERRFVVALGALVAFSAGGSQVGLAAGPFLPVVEGLPVATSQVLAVSGLALLAGSWTGAPRMIKAVAQDYGSLGPRRSIAALLPSYLIAQTAVLFGIPISFNEIVISAVVGSGLAAGADAISATKVRRTLAAWAASFLIALAVTFAVVYVIPM
jgi:PiT family inorganic phosphate transporter